MTTVIPAPVLVRLGLNGSTNAVEDAAKNAIEFDGLR
jgi:hypothetical protein